MIAILLSREPACAVEHRPISYISADAFKPESHHIASEDREAPGHVSPFALEAFRSEPGPAELDSKRLLDLC